MTRQTSSASMATHIALEERVRKLEKENKELKFAICCLTASISLDKLTLKSLGKLKDIIKEYEAEGIIDA